VKAENRMIERGLQKLRFLHRGYFKWAPLLLGLNSEGKSDKIEKI